MKTGSQSASTVSVRMKKLMNQRKVWEAEGMHASQRSFGSFVLRTNHSIL